MKGASQCPPELHGTLAAQICPAGLRGHPGRDHHRGCHRRRRLSIRAFGAAALARWAALWLAAWLLMLPIVIFISPLVQRLVAAITREAPR